MTQCQGCDWKWSSKLQVHCMACHRHFSRYSVFDAHQSVNYSRDKAVRCRDPRRKDEKFVQEESGMWRGVADENARSRRRGRTAR